MPNSFVSKRTALVLSLIGWLLCLIAVLFGRDDRVSLFEGGLLVTLAWSLVTLAWIAIVNRREQRGSLIEGLRKSELVHHDTGARIITEGEPADCLYVLVSGHVQVTRSDEYGSEITVADLGPGAVFGEQGLLLGQARNANVTALEAVTLMRVDKATFMDIVAASDSDYQQLKSLAAARTGAAGQS